MSLVRKIFMRVQGLGGYIASTDSDQVDADTTTDADFTETLGRKADAAAAGAVTETDSQTAYLKQIVNHGLGTAPGSPIVINKTLEDINTGGSGSSITAVSTGGTVLIDEVSIQPLDDEDGLVTSLTLVTDDTVPLIQELLKLDNSPIQQNLNDLLANKRYVNRINHPLAVGKKVYLRATGAVGGSGCDYRVILKGTVIDEGAALEAA